MKLFSYSFLVTLLMSGGLRAGSLEPQPVDIYLYARVTDHVNIEVTEDRLRHILPMIDRYANAHPREHAAVTVLFSGAVSQALAERNSQTHILDFVLDYIHRGIIQPGYDGADEPTYKKKPLVDFTNTASAEQRWRARMTVADKLLAEGRAPLTGEPRPSEDGGLKKMQEVFGPAKCVNGVILNVPDALLGMMPEVGADSETVHAIRRYNTAAIMFGIPEANFTHSPQYRTWAASFSKALSPVPGTSPELYWQDGVLRSSESGEADYHVFRASDGPDAFKSTADKLDRTRTRVIHVELASLRSYLNPPFAMRPPLAFAYEHPDHPQLPQAAWRGASDVGAAYAKEDALIRWLAEDFFPTNRGSRFVSSGDLEQMAEPATGYTIPMSALRAALAELVKSWGSGTVPPEYLAVNSHYLSLADMFQVMADALAGLNRTGKLPDSVRVVPVFGPAETSKDRGPAQGEVTVGSVARVCSELTGRLHDSAWTPVPKNSIPFRVKVDGVDMNAAQFLRLMAEAVVNPAPEAKLQVKMTEMFWGRDATYVRTRSIRDEGATWTIKPAVLTR
jgi:hypothetical protein